jgi:serine/threonine protein kinase
MASLLKKPNEDAKEKGQVYVSAKKKEKIVWEKEHLARLCWERRNPQVAIASEEVFTLKFVPNKHVSKVKKEVLIQAAGHPFLVQLFTYFQTEDSLCFVMEYLEGGTLQSLLSRLKGFNEDLARFYVADIVLAVNFMHKCSIVHRDIKPHNILLDKNGKCKIADFGCDVGTMTEYVIVGRATNSNKAPAAENAQ